MIEIREGYNPEENKISILIKTALIKKYYNNLSGLLKNEEGIPTGTEVKRVDIDTVNILFPLPKDSTFKRTEEGMGMVGISSDKMENFYSTINKFIKGAIRKEFRSTEFLPIGEDYDLKNLKQDVKNAIRNKRNFVILHTYAEYLKTQEPIKKGEKRDIEFNQVYVNYGTSLYSDVAILIQQGKLSELRKILEPMFKITKWI